MSKQEEEKDNFFIFYYSRGKTSSVSGAAADTRIIRKSEIVIDKIARGAPRQSAKCQIAEHQLAKKVNCAWSMSGSTKANGREPKSCLG
jgi:hypothetical protein